MELRGSATQNGASRTGNWPRGRARTERRGRLRHRWENRKVEMGGSHMSQSVGSERVSMELMGSATWPVGWDHDLGGVFSGRAMREAAEIQILNARPRSIRAQSEFRTLIDGSPRLP